MSINPTNPKSQGLLSRAFALACSAQQLANDAQKASDDGRGGDAWTAYDAATSVNRTALSLLVRAAAAEIKEAQ